MQDSQADNLLAFIANDHIVICHLIIGCDTRLLEVDVKDVRVLGMFFGDMHPTLIGQANWDSAF